jgi:hypothetical protein
LGAVSQAAVHAVNKTDAAIGGQLMIIALTGRQL